MRRKRKREEYCGGAGDAAVRACEWQHPVGRRGRRNAECELVATPPTILLAGRARGSEKGGVRARGLNGGVLSRLRTQIAVVSQDPVLFADTIASNIRYGNQTASPEEIRDAAFKANALEVRLVY